MGNTPSLPPNPYSMVDNVGELFTSVPEGLELAYKDLTTFATPDNVANITDFVPVLGPEVRGIQIAVAETTGGVLGDFNIDSKLALALQM